MNAITKSETLNNVTHQFNYTAMNERKRLRA